MRSRSLVVAGALLLALLATAGVFLYINNVREDAETGGTLTTVWVSATNIPAGTDLNTLVDSGGFVEIQVPSDALVEGSVTALDQLRNTTATVPILEGEQIALSRLSGTDAELPGGVFGLQQGYEAIAVRLESQQLVGEKLQVGDRVTVFAHFSDVSVIPGNLTSLLKGKGGKTPPAARQVGDITTVLIPETRVLAVSTPVQATTDTQGDESRVTREQIVTMELTVPDAASLVHAQNAGKVWLGLIRPGDKVPAMGPISLGGVFGR